MTKNRSGFLPVGFLVVDIPPMIIPAAWGSGGVMSFPITAIKGRPIDRIDITTIQVVSGIHPIIDMGTTIHTLTAIIGTLTLTIAVTGGLDSLLKVG